jgi:ATP-dependent DNA ligase
MARICDVGRMWNARRRCGSFWRHGRGIQYVEHAEGHGDRLFAAACSLGLEGIVSKKLDAPYRSGPSKIWIKIKNQKESAATRVVDGTF